MIISIVIKLLSTKQNNTQLSNSDASYTKKITDNKNYYTFY